MVTAWDDAKFDDGNDFMFSGNMGIVGCLSDIARRNSTSAACDNVDKNRRRSFVGNCSPPTSVLGITNGG